MEATDWPLILAGPIVRRVEPRLACVWVALRAPCTVRLDIWDGLEPANTTKPPFATATAHSLRAADFLHIGLPVIEIGISNAPLLPGHIYSYSLTLTDESDANKQKTLSSLGLLQDRAGQVVEGRLVVKPHLALGYQAGMLPSFLLPPIELTNLKLVHASCRRPFANCPDAMTFVDDFIGNARTNATQRPHQLFLTGDQIYADDVAAPMLHTLIEAGNEITGNFVVGDELIGGVEHLPTRWPNQPPGTDSVRLWPATQRYFPAGVRRNAVVNDARFSTGDADSHLLTFGEFCAMYLFCFSNEMWPDQLPLQEEVFDTPQEIDRPEMQIWRLHTGLESGFLSEDDPKLKPTDQFDLGLKRHRNKADKNASTDAFTPSNVDVVMRAACRAFRASFAAHRTVLHKFRDGLPKVRRALANVPTYMMFDDHEVTDDWYLSKSWRDQVLSSPLGRTTVRNGLLAYALFQAWGNDPKQFAKNIPSPTGGTPEPGPHLQLLALIPQLFKHQDPAPPDRTASNAVDLLFGLDGNDPPVKWHYSVPGSRHLVHVLDARTRRTYASRVSGPGNASAQALADQLPPGPLPAGIDVLIVVSSLTVLGVPIIDELLGPALYHFFDLKHGNHSAQPGLHPDAIEAWPYDPKTFEALLKRLEPFKRVVLLSGDVHFAGSAAMTYWKKGDTNPSARIGQFISSGAKNLFNDIVRKAGAYLAFMQKLIDADVGIERLGYNNKADDLLRLPSGTRPAPSLRDRLRSAPVLLPTEGWPAGTNENSAKPPDWAWRLDIIRDTRPDAERSPNVRPVDLVPGNPTADVARNLDGYRRAAVRHVKELDKQLDGLAQARQMLFASNIGLVRFERTPGAPPGPLTAVQELYALAEHVSVATLPELVTLHRISLEVPSTAPPDVRLRPTIGTPS